MGEGNHALYNLTLGYGHLSKERVKIAKLLLEYRLGKKANAVAEDRFGPGWNSAWIWGYKNANANDDAKDSVFAEDRLGKKANAVAEDRFGPGWNSAWIWGYKN